MARRNRKKSESGYYHVILRGVNRQDIFFDNADREKMLNTFQRFQNESDVQISAYCLMGNHIHLLVNAADGLDLFIKKIASSYVFYFNHKYDRIGHLFQDRYRSEAVETDSYLLTVFRYILQNPLKAGICPPNTYPWSSWNSLEGEDGICDITRIAAIAGNLRALKDFVLVQNDDQCLEAENVHTLSDDEVLQKVMQITGGENPLTVVQHPRKERDMLIAKMKEAGLSIRQISRLTGINRNVIQRA